MTAAGPMTWLLLFFLFIVAVFLIAYSRSPASRARTLATKAVTTIEALDRDIRTQHRQVREAVSLAAKDHVQNVRMGRLRAIPVDELNRQTSGLRLQAVKDAGLRNLADLQGWDVNRLVQLRGIGPKSAGSIAYLVSSLTSQSDAKPIPHPVPSETGTGRTLLEAICLLGWFLSWFPDQDKRLPAVLQEFRAHRNSVMRKTTIARWIWKFWKHPDFQAGLAEAEALSQDMEGDGSAAQLHRELSTYLETIATFRRNGIEGPRLIDDCEANQARYACYLTEHLGQSGRSAVAAEESVAVLLASQPPTAHKSLTVLPASQPLPTACIPASSSTLPFNGTATGHVGTTSIEHQEMIRRIIDVIRRIQASRVAEALKTLQPVPVPQPVGAHIPAFGNEPGFSTLQIGFSEAIAERSIPRPPEGETAYKVRWVPANEPIEVAGLCIPGGMVYVGLSLKTTYGQQDPSLINPNLPVGKQSVDISLKRTDYWPNYSGVTPDARRAYLQWLATGREDPTADIGCVFLFFYGLERRALVDHKDGVDVRQELSVIIDEVRRLVSIYGQNGTFRYYAMSFINYLLADKLIASSEQELPPDAEPSYELPFGLRLGLGKLAIEKRPVPVAWALRWAMLDPTVFKRTPVVRCQEEFGVLFRHRYSQHYGEGIILPVNKARLQIRYQPGSSSLRGTPLQKYADGIPDIAAITGPQKKLQNLVNECSSDLDRYSRFLGRNPGKAGTLEALVSLPMIAWPESIRSASSQMKREVEMTDVVLRWSELLLKLSDSGTLPRGKVPELASKMGEIGIGIEPDLISRGRQLNDDDFVVLFAAAPCSGDDTQSAAYTSGVLTVDLASTVASADGEASTPVIQILMSQIDSWQELSENSRKRLKAHLRLRIAQPSSLVSLKGKLDTLPFDSKRAIGRMLTRLAHVDSAVSPEEVRLLEKIYKLLQLDAKLVYSDLHIGQTNTADNTAISAVPVPGSNSLNLDTKKIALLQQETDNIAALLAGIFEDGSEQASAQSAEETESESDDVLLGLDAEHSAFLRLLISRPEWSREDLSDAATGMELMLDGVLESINEAALDHFDLPIAEGDDPIEINQEVVGKVIA